MLMWHSCWLYATQYIFYLSKCSHDLQIFCCFHHILLRFFAKQILELLSDPLGGRIGELEVAVNSSSSQETEGK